jgi:hypothetical protein
MPTNLHHQVRECRGEEGNEDVKLLKLMKKMRMRRFKKTSPQPSPEREGARNYLYLSPSPQGEGLRMR